MFCECLAGVKQLTDIREVTPNPQQQKIRRCGWIGNCELVNGCFQSLQRLSTDVAGGNALPQIDRFGFLGVDRRGGQSSQVLKVEHAHAEDDREPFEPVPPRPAATLLPSTHFVSRNRWVAGRLGQQLGKVGLTQLTLSP